MSLFLLLNLYYNKKMGIISSKGKKDFDKDRDELVKLINDSHRKISKRIEMSEDRIEKLENRTETLKDIIFESNKALVDKLSKETIIPKNDSDIFS